MIRWNLYRTFEKCSMFYSNEYKTFMSRDGCFTVSTNQGNISIEDIFENIWSILMSIVATYPWGSVEVLAYETIQIVCANGDLEWTIIC
ncbi:hypothetical protein EUGRSUZ_G00282 [Eucalyptus grandis]|uniref:Uncharacterized protein n=2 Tax=Eucalyptus grandis TaxID=71139 RepID=A0ACC3K0T6_EUCGR|nr:hypothetical protein EUGRSUZ_G00282 [Eucalyptus grandis]